MYIYTIIHKYTHLCVANSPQIRTRPFICNHALLIRLKNCRKEPKGKSESESVWAFILAETMYNKIDFFLPSHHIFIPIARCAVFVNNINMYICVRETLSSPSQKKTHTHKHPIVRTTLARSLASFAVSTEYVLRAIFSNLYTHTYTCG